MSTEVASLDSYVEVAPDSTGKKIRNLIVTVPVTDGSQAQVYMQVVGIADADGFPLGDPTVIQQEMLQVLKDIKQELALLREEME